jgi:hypothetical protein
MKDMEPELKVVEKEMISALNVVVERKMKEVLVDANNVGVIVPVL